MTVGLYRTETRVGFIYYAKKAYLLSNLTRWQNTDSLIDELEIPFDGSEGTNIEEGIKLASNQFSTYGHRENAKKVIVILASSYQELLCLEMATTMILPRPLIHLRTTEVLLSQLHLAVRYCSRHHNSTLVKVDDFSKAQFLKKLFPSKTKFWIGLTQNYYGIYTWPDGSRLLDYSMWAPGYPRYGQGDCVYMYQYSGFQFGWFNDDCNNDWNYICQAHPCDTDHYCELVDDLT
uniref:C-type lectin domain-containing protein n=1 Tax=Heterorhabditis bacteriophora TaxID=37862 RepID=A0A1I7X255_HETBA